MRKIIFAINITIDGYADHTAVIADDELHEFYANLLNDVDVVLLGRKTYLLLESFWPNAKDDPRNSKGMTEFADKINPIKKIVFSNTLKNVHWNNSELSENNLIEEIEKFKKQSGKNISVGSLSLASQLTKNGLIDEYWFLVQPIILGTGKFLFENFNSRVNLKFVKTKALNSGVVAIHYKKETN